MDLTNLLPQSHVTIFEQMPQSREELIQKLAQPLIDDAIVTDGEHYIRKVIEREKLVTTVVGHSVCIPHARSMGVTRLGLSVGILPEPMQFSFEEEAEEARIYFLIAISALAPVSHLPLLQHLAKFTRYAKKVEKLASCTTPAASAKLLHAFKPRK